ncbi:MAG: trypsin-like peptidase domain-containing protein [Candidatus Hydrogenedentes bacterium]|nr:trypsin-like peptidase domain-containing protein [Candidatus Hydrogenedentota bacterium]
MGAGKSGIIHLFHGGFNPAVFLLVLWMALPVLAVDATSDPELPWDPAGLLTPPEKVVYGSDDRIDVYQETDPVRRSWAAAVCALVDSTRITRNADGTYTLNVVAFSKFGLPACPDEPFGSQPTCPYCTGFLVGTDLVATAGHCLSASRMSTVYVVFGYEMLDPVTPRLTLQPEQVYRPVAILSTVGTGDQDHTLFRVDRPVTAPGAHPLPIRRSGAVQVGDPVGVIGYPSGLPLKLAFGSSTYVRDTSNTYYFVANTDTYGGNSGSPIINPVLGIVEGILVRGETDYVNAGTCFRSNTCAPDACRGEDCTRITLIQNLIPETVSHTGTISLDKDYYPCDGTARVSVADLDLAGLSSVSIPVYADNGDVETVVLTEYPTGSGQFSGTLSFQSGSSPTPDDGLLQADHGTLIRADYLDTGNADGRTAVVSAAAVLDCVAPTPGTIDVLNVFKDRATLRVTADEPVSVAARWGTACESLTGYTTSTGSPGTDLYVTLGGLTPLTTYAYVLTITDRAGNSVTVPDAGCATFATTDRDSYYTAVYTDASPASAGRSWRSLVFVPNSTGGYALCEDRVGSLPVDPAGGTIQPLGDDAYTSTPIGGAGFSFNGILYNSLFISSNGYVTFTQGDTASQPDPDTHFQLPRIAILMTDLNPAAGGSVSTRQLADRLVITWLNVPLKTPPAGLEGTNANTFQLELFTSNVIRMTWLHITATSAVVGLSPGGGVPAGFIPDTFEQLPDSAAFFATARPHSADRNGDGVLDLSETLRVIQFYNTGSYSCLPGTEDGYYPGPGAQNCDFHDADYNPRNWQISLSELLRLIQLYNARGYLYDPWAEDEFRPKFLAP